MKCASVFSLNDRVSSLRCDDYSTTASLQHLALQHLALIREMSCGQLDACLDHDFGVMRAKFAGQRYLQLIIALTATAELMELALCAQPHQHDQVRNGSRLSGRPVTTSCLMRELP